MKRLALLLLVVTGCGPYIDEDGSGGNVPGPVCYLDEDCVPNGCCGQGTGVVHVSDAPSCRGMTCTNGCPVNSVDCGCGIPVCRNQRCVVARTVSESCPSF